MAEKVVPKIIFALVLDDGEEQNLKVGTNEEK